MKLLTLLLSVLLLATQSSADSPSRVRRWGGYGPYGPPPPFYGPPPPYGYGWRRRHWHRRPVQTIITRTVILGV